MGGIPLRRGTCSSRKRKEVQDNLFVSGSVEPTAAPIGPDDPPPKHGNVKTCTSFTLFGSQHPARGECCNNAPVPCHFACNMRPLWHQGRRRGTKQFQPRISMKFDSGNAWQKYAVANLIWPTTSPSEPVKSSMPKRRKVMRASLLGSSSGSRPK